MTNAEIAQLRSDAALLRSIVSRKVMLKKIGGELKGCCPFHKEKTPSFTVYEDGHFHCFGCAAHGTVFDYVMKAEGVDFTEAYRRVAAEAGISTGNGKFNDDLWQPMVPPPPNTPPPTSDQLRADVLHEYFSADDTLICYVRRIEARGGKRKQFLPLTYGELNGKRGWHNKAPNAPRPLYRLNALSHAAPDTTVILTEGEKAAEAAQRLFPAMIAMTWMGGASADGTADFTSLQGHPVVLWPDADQPGRDVMGRIARGLPQARVINTNDLPDGYDAADLEHDGCDDPEAWLQARLREPEPTQLRILTGDAFISSFVPPDWLIDGIIQRGRLYACTSLTGHGKTAVWLFNACMVQAGRMIGNLDVVQGNVLILAGENPEDLKARMHGMVGAYKLKPAQLPYVLPGNFPLTEDEADKLKQDIAALVVPFALILGDTASSFFPGEDENSNVQAGNYARTLRTLTDCTGNPAVVVLSHPTKGAHRDNLLPRGGGAFLNELDGNLRLWSDSVGEVTELHWCGKIRGPDFSAVGYRLRPIETGFIDLRDRPVMTIVAETMSEEAVVEHAKQTRTNEDAVLRMLRDNPGWSFAQMARHAGWVDEDDRPEKWRVQRAIDALAADKLIHRPRRGGKWQLTDKGKDALAGEG